MPLPRNRRTPRPECHFHFGFFAPLRACARRSSRLTGTRHVILSIVFITSTVRDSLGPREFAWSLGSASVSYTLVVRRVRGEDTPAKIDLLCSGLSDHRLLACAESLDDLDDVLQVGRQTATTSAEGIHLAVVPRHLNRLHREGVAYELVLGLGTPRRQRAPEVGAPPQQHR